MAQLRDGEYTIKYDPVEQVALSHFMTDVITVPNTPDINTLQYMYGISVVSSQYMISGDGTKWLLQTVRCTDSLLVRGYRDEISALLKQIKLRALLLKINLVKPDVTPNEQLKQTFTG